MPSPGTIGTDTDRAPQDLLYKQFQKSPENPYVASSRPCIIYQVLLTRNQTRFNQVNIDYNASKEEKLEALKAKKVKTEERLREKQ